jgi:diguanylate cyclase (GGDEF)-like protein
LPDYGSAQLLSPDRFDYTESEYRDGPPNVTLPRTPLQSRFGRRLLLLFVGCALIPIVVLATLSYRHVSSQLLMQSEIRLHQANKALGLAIYERLLLLDATLRSIPPAALVQLGAGSPLSRTPAQAPTDARELEAGRMLTAGLDLVASRRFVALEFVSATGVRTPVFGRLERNPVDERPIDSDLEAGLPAVIVHPRPGASASVYMLRRIDRRGGIRGTLVGEVSPEFLWGTLDQGMPSAGTAISVVDDSGVVLFSSTAGAPASSGVLEADEQYLRELTRPTADSVDKAPSDAAPYVTSSWPLVLDEVFASSNWHLVLGQSKAEVLGPMSKFTPTLLAVVAVSCLVALLLSLQQIRRGIVPLVELQAGTRRIAQRDFGSRVSVNSRDEFEELGASFNSMAAQLDRQFQALATAAEIDRAVLSTRDVAGIMETVIARVRDVCPCDLVSITLVAPDGTKSLPGILHDYRDSTSRHLRVDLRLEDVQVLLEGSETLTLPLPGQELPAYLAPMGERGATSVFVLPLRYQSQLIGVIALGDSASPPPPEEYHLQARRLADQAAVALTNARMLDQVRTLAFVDSLTGLPNRLSYKERLSQALDDAHRDSKLVAAFFIDLDHFSRINDTLGHDAGDQLLQHVAVRLRSSCRGRDDQVTPAAELMAPEVARLGGDEFTVIMPGLTDPEDAAKLARRILSSLAHPIRVADQEVFVNASIGIAIYPFDGEDLETLLMHADTAMYKAKEQGGSSYQTYSRSMNAMAMQRLTLENDLRRALEREEFEVHYQPIVDASTGLVSGAEGLVRWRHPDLGLLLPGEFIPLAEENGLIVPLGEWVLRTVCGQNREWQEAGLHRIRVVCNLSSRQLKRTLADTVGRALQATALEARYLGLELTESMLVNHEKEGTDTLHALRAMGLHLSVDDFGTGYSSFSYLKHFPLDALKIDRSFVREIASHPDDAAITTAIIAMGHALGLKVVAEGVETEAQRNLLRKQGCDEMQGYLFSRPACAADFAKLIAKPAAREAARRWKVGSATA